MKRVEDGTNKGARDGAGALSDQGMKYRLTYRNDLLSDTDIYLC